ncbi:MAG: ABC transporter permease [Lactovum sp.]
MNKIFSQRRQVYNKQNFRYLRYVFNDHFVLFLFILLSALATEYIRFVSKNTLDLFFRILIFILVSLLSLTIGKFVSLLEEADALFLLTKEEELKKILSKNQKYSLILPLIVISLSTAITSPLIKLPIFFWLFWLISLLLFKYFLLELKLKSFQKSGTLDWQALIDYEQKRKMNLLKLFSIFTDVKGISSQSKRRSYLDFLLPKKEKSFYSYLLTRTFLRSADYFALSLRLLLLSILALLFIKNQLIIFVFVSLMNYLLIFQLLALKKSQDFQPMIKVYPVDPLDSSKALQNLLSKILAFILSVEFISFLFLALAEKRYQQFLINLIFIILSYLFFNFYIKFKLKK